MKKKINKFIYSSIITAIFFIIIGVLLVINPKMSLDVLSYVISIFLILNGIVLFALDYRLGGYLIFFDNVISGILSLILGVLLLLNPKTLTVFIPLVFAIWFIITAVFKLRLSSLLDGGNKVFSIIIAILTIICGILLIAKPYTGAVTIMFATGIVLIIYSVMDVIDMVLLKKHISDVEKNIKKFINF